MLKRIAVALAAVPAALMISLLFAEYTGIAPSPERDFPVSEVTGSFNGAYTGTITDSSQGYYHLAFTSFHVGNHEIKIMGTWQGELPALGTDVKVVSMGSTRFAKIISSGQMYLSGGDTAWIDFWWSVFGHFA